MVTLPKGSQGGTGFKWTELNRNEAEFQGEADPAQRVRNMAKVPGLSAKEIQHQSLSMPRKSPFWGAVFFVPGRDQSPRGGGGASPYGAPRLALGHRFFLSTSSFTLGAEWPCFLNAGPNWALPSGQWLNAPTLPNGFIMFSPLPILTHCTARRCT